MLIFFAVFQTAKAIGSMISVTNTSDELSYMTNGTIPGTFNTTSPKHKDGVIMKKNFLIKFYILIAVFTVFPTLETFASIIVQPSSTQNQTQPISIPLTLNNNLSEDIMSVEMEIGYNPDVLTATGISLTGSVLENQNYLFASNTSISGTIFVALSMFTSITNGTGMLLNLDFIVKGASGETSDITIVSSRFNNIIQTTSDGLFTVAPNAAPTFSHIIAQTSAEDMPHSFTLTATDLESNPCDLSLTFQSSDETLVLANSINYTCMSDAFYVTYTPQSNQSGSFRLSVTVSDGHLTSTSDIAITVTSVNDPPTFLAIDDISTNENIAVRAMPITIIDDETAPCSMEISLASSNSTLIQSGNMSYTCTGNNYYLSFTPTTTLSGSAIITVTVTDPQGLSAISSFNLTVTETNDRPILTTIEDHTIYEDTSISGISLTTTDLEDMPCSLDFTATTTDLSLIPNENIAYTCNAGVYQLAITPVADQNGNATVIITLTDSQGLTASTQFDLTVTAVNDVPVLANPISNRIATTENAFAYIIPSNTFVDIDSGDILTYTATQSNGNALPEWLSFEPTTREFSGFPTNSDGGSITIMITATDSSSQSVTDTFVLSVNSTNSAPILDNPIANQTINEDVAWSFTFAENTFHDDDVAFGDSLSYTAMLVDGSPLPFWLTFDINNRHFSGIPTNYDVGIYTITIIAEDTLNLTAMDSFNLTIVNVNDAPEISDISRGASTISVSGLSIDEDTQVTDISFSIYDIEDSNLTVSLTSTNTSLVPVSNMSYNCTNGSCSMSLTPAVNENGTGIITIIVTDPQGMTTSNAFDLAVRSINDPHAVTSITGQTIDEDTIATGISMTVTDIEDAPCSFEITTISSNGTVISSNNISYTCSANVYHFSITPNADQSGTSTIIVTITDSVGLTVSTSFTVSVANVNDAPVLSNPIPDQIATEDTSYSFTLATNTFSDNDLSFGDSLTLSAMLHNGNPLPSWLTFNSSSQYFSGMPLNADVGMITITVTAEDTNNEIATDSFHLTVIGVNDPPVIGTITGQTIEEDAILQTSLTVTDIENDSLLLSATSSNNAWVADHNITFTGTGESRIMTITPTANASGIVTITVAVSDGNLTATTSFELTVTAINDPPIIGAIDDIIQFENTVIEAVELTATDVETPSCSLGINIMSSNTTMIPISNIAYTCVSNSFYFSLTPVMGQSGTSKITITVTDSNGSAVSTSFNININLPPELSTIPDIGTAVGEISFTFVESSGNMVSLTVTSSDQSLVSDANISINGHVGNTLQLATTAEIAQSVSLQLTQESNMHGLVTIAVIASSTAGTVTETFNVIVSPPGSGNALSFNGASNYIDIPYDANLNSSVFTVSLWVRTEGHENTYRSPITMRTANFRGLLIYASPANQWQFTLGDGTSWISIAESSVIVDQWTHLALTYNGNEMAAYVNGVLQDTVTMSYMPQSSSPLRIGAGQSEASAGYFWDGKIDEIRIYNIAQTQEEIRSNMCQKVNTAENGLVAYYRMDHFSGAMLTDLSGADYHGTLYNMNDSNWIVSGAPLGDRSLFDASGILASDFSVFLSHSDGDAFTAFGESGSYSSLHVYLVDESPLSYTADDFSELYDDHYFGAYPVGESTAYNVVYYYSGHSAIGSELNLQLASRSNNAGTWIDAMADLDTVTHTLSKTNISAFSSMSATEFIPGMMTQTKTPPRMSDIEDLTISEDTVSSAISFTVTDMNEQALTMTFNSSNTSLIRSSGITGSGDQVSSNGSDYIVSATSTPTTVNLTITPENNQSGTSEISILLTDPDGLTSTKSFLLTVTMVNDPPVIGTIMDQTTNEDVLINSISFTVTDIEDTTPCIMDMTFTSSNISIIPIENISYNCNANTYILTIIPESDQHGLVAISVSVTDSGLNSSTRTFNLEVTPENDAPELTNPIADNTTTEDTYYSFTFADNVFTDVDSGDSLSFTSELSNGSALPSWLSFDSNNRRFYGTPTNNDVGVYNIKVTAEDTLGLSVMDSFYLTVENVNDAPEISDISRGAATISVSGLSIDEDTQVTDISFSITDIDDTSLTVSLTSSNTTLVPLQNMNHSCNTNGNCSMSLIPAANKYGTAIITVTVTDPQGLNSSNTFDLSVLSVNDSPVLGSISGQTIAKETVLQTSLTVTDVETLDCNNLSISIVSSNMVLIPNENISHTCQANTVSLSLTPASNQTGVSTIIITVSDPEGLTDMKSFDVNVTTGNLPPTISFVSSTNNLTMNENSVLELDLMVSDTEGDNLTLTASSSNTSLVSTNNLVFSGTDASRTLTIIPTSNAYGTLVITVAACDGDLTATESFDLTVVHVNHAPEISVIQNQTVDEDTETNAISFTVADIDGDNLTVSASSSNLALVPSENITLSGSGLSRSITINPLPNANGIVLITIEVSDGSLTTTRSFNLTVSPINDIPVLVNPISDQIATEGSSYVLTFNSNTFDDVDSNDNLTYISTQSNGSSLPAWLSFNATTRTFSGTPANNDVGTITIALTATDNSSDSVTDTFELTVNNTNTGPVLDYPIADQSAAEDVLYSFTFEANTFQDDDVIHGDILSYAATLSDGNPLPSWLSFDANNRTFSGTPLNSDVGTMSINVMAKDTLNVSATDTFILTVENVNDAPEISHIVKDGIVISNAYMSINEDTVADGITFSISDIDDTNLTVQAVSSNTILLPNANINHTCTNNNCTMTLTPETDQNGAARITITVTDSHGQNASNAFNLNVNPVNDQPVVSSIAAHVINEDEILSGVSFTVTDVEDAPCSFDITASSSNTSLIPNTNINDSCNNGVYQLSITPNANQNGTANITINATDSQGLAASRSFEVSVAPVNDAPTLSDISSQSMNEGESVQISFIADDIDSSSLTVNAVSADQVLISNDNLTLANNGNAYNITVTPNAYQTGQTEITISASDGTVSTSKTFAITVNESHYVISGHVSSFTGDSLSGDLQDVVLSLSGTYSYSTITDESGNYAFMTVRPGSYTLTAFKSNDISLDLADAIKILKGSVKLTHLTCYEQIAADAYIDGYFGAFDAAKVARYVGGLENCLNNDCLFWQFIPEEIVSCDTWPLIEIENSRRYINLDGDISGQDFIGIGCGNVSQ